MIRKLAIILLLAFSLKVHAAKDLYISKGIRQLLPIAVNELSYADIMEKRLGENISEVIKSDLISSGIFKLVSEDAFIERTKGVSHMPDFYSWRQINANLLFNGSIERKGANLFNIKVALWDNVTQKRIISLSFQGEVKIWRRVAHKIADKIYESVTGDQGYFDTKIYYIAEKQSGNKKLKRLAVMDYDGANHKFLSNDQVLNITPRLSPNGKYLLYVSYLKGMPQVFIKNLITGHANLLISDSGMSFAPRFCADGSKIVFSLAKNGATNIWEMDLKTSKKFQRTHSLVINTSPTYSPDGGKIYFNSDRSGSKQIYSMNHDGSDVVRISFGEGSYSSPILSPNGKYLAFIKSIRGENFYLGIMDIDGNNERLLSNGYLVDSITWSPNSRMIAFAKTIKRGVKGKAITKISTIDLEGLNENEIDTPEEATDPEWSWNY